MSSADTRTAADKLARPLGGLSGKVCAKCGDEKVWRQAEKSKHGAVAYCRPCNTAQSKKSMALCGPSAKVRANWSVASKAYRERQKAKDPVAYLAKQADTQKQLKRATKLERLAHKGGACMDCGADDLHPACYDFHHRDPATKVSGAIPAALTLTDAVIAELAKCDLLCSNCHKTRHATGNLLGESN